MNHHLLQINKIRLFDHSDINHSSITHSFALDDALCLSVSETKETILRLWVHKPTVVFGIPDSRLPYFNEGIEYLIKEKYEVIIRNSGGLTVLLDEGILNLSFVFPDTNDIHQGYEAMVEFIKEIFKDETSEIEAYEITESYCPGSYDLSIGGKKFAGISQRRVKNGSAVQIYLCVEGDGSKRAELIRNFYQIAKKDEETKFKYPNVNPDVMASLEQLLQKRITVQDVIKLIVEKLRENGITIYENTLNEREQQWYDQRIKLMNERNKSVNSL